MMILYGSSMSPFVRKVLAFAGEKGVELDVRPVGIGDQNPEFRAASPMGKMPAPGRVERERRFFEKLSVIKTPRPRKETRRLF